ncbi:MAG: hypothetical protein K6F50_04060 [Kiritimatiellae bacterium]|nr:hypothetical protein [Kiritimatiellia bacterium]
MTKAQKELVDILRKSAEYANGIADRKPCELNADLLEAAIDFAGAPYMRRDLFDAARFSIPESLQKPFDGLQAAIEKYHTQLKSGVCEEENARLLADSLTRMADCIEAPAPQVNHSENPAPQANHTEGLTSQANHTESLSPHETKMVNEIVEGTLKGMKDMSSKVTAIYKSTKRIEAGEAAPPTKIGAPTKDPGAVQRLAVIKYAAEHLREHKTDYSAQVFRTWEGGQRYDNPDSLRIGVDNLLKANGLPDLPTAKTDDKEAERVQAKYRIFLTEWGKKPR